MGKGCLVAGGIFGAIAVVLVIFVLSMWSWVGGFYDKANASRLAATARDQEAQQVYNNVWTTISGKAKVSEKYADDFKAMFIGGNDARYKDKQNMAMMWIQEANPNLDPSLYRELSQTIESKRNEYLGMVKTQISVAQEHNKLVTSSGSMVPCFVLGFLGNHRNVCDTVAVRQVTSTRTQDAFTSGKDDNVNLFEEKK